MKRINAQWDIEKEDFANKFNRDFQIYSGEYKNESGIINLYGRNLNDQKVNLEIIGFDPYLYIPRPNGEYVGFDDNRLEKIYFHDQRDLNHVRRMNYTYEADINIIKRFMVDADLQLKHIEPEILYIDVETDPEMKLISCAFSLGNGTWCIEDEDNIAFEINRLIENEAFDGITGWNLDFDIGVINKRLGLLKKDKRFFYIDMMDQFKQAWANEGLSSYGLDAVSERILGSGKIDTGGKMPHELERDELIRYNINDVDLLVELENELSLLKLVNNVAYINQTLIQYSLSKYQIGDVGILNEAKNRNIVLANSRSVKKEGKYQGAYVYAKPGYYDSGIIALDFSSMYPSAAIQKNISFETILKNGGYSTEMIGILPSLMKRWTKERKRVGKKTVRGEAYKKMSNSVYGLSGMGISRIFNERVAEDITGTARDIILKSKEYIENLGYEIILIDTDSLYVLCSEDEGGVISNILNEFIQNDLGFNEFNLEFEGYFDSGYIIQKKHYVLRDKNGDDKLRGIAPRRGDRSIYLKELYMLALDMIFDGQHKSDVRKFIIDKIHNEIYGKDLREIARPVGIDLKKEYDTDVQQMRAYQYSKDYMGFELKFGDKVLVIPVKAVPDGYPYTDVIAYCENPYVFLFQIDYKKIIRTLITSLDTMFGDLNVQNKLGDFIIE